jgi:hypothetical protein
VEQLAETSGACGWVLAEVQVVGWHLIDVLRWAERRPTRSAVAEDLLRRALAIDAEVGT